MCRFMIALIIVRSHRFQLASPIQNTRLYILVDEKLAPIGQVGELCIAGDCLAAGYLNNPSLTEKYFYTDIMNHAKNVPFGRFGVSTGRWKYSILR